jgi:uncharacterized lipoprotein
MRALLVGVVVAVLLAGCSEGVDVEGADRWRERADEAYRLAAVAAGDRISLAPGDTLAGLADTQRCPGREWDSIRHRVDATLELAAPAPADLAEVVRAAVPRDYEVSVEVEPDRLVLGVVSTCRSVPDIQGVELAFEGRYRVDV